MNRSLLLPVVAAALLPRFAAAAPDALNLDPAKCVIVAPAKPNAIVAYAVDELRHHVKLVTGAELPVAAQAPAGKYPLYVGTAPTGDTKPLATEEARTHVTAGGAWLYGKDLIKGKKKEDSEVDVALAHDTEAGTLFAVYDFLEQDLGIHWVEPGEAGITYVPSSTLTLKPGDTDWVPQLVQRHMRTAYKQALRDRALEDVHIPADMKFSNQEFAQRQHDEIVWQRRMRMGGDVNFTYGHAFRQWWAKYGKTHPEWFALSKNGKRGPVSPSQADRVKMCVSNEELVKQIVKDHFAAHKGLVVNACENDSRNFCNCPQCQALDVLLPGEENLDVDDRVLTDRYVHFTNAVLREAKKYDPRAKTVFYAYSRYNLPPRRERLDDDVIVFLLPNLAMTHQELVDYYAGWKRANAKEVFMRPNDLCQDTGLPLGFDQAIFTKFKMADDAMKIRGTDYDTCWGFWPESGITNYIMARAFFRPERSFEDWNNEYCATFGAAKDDLAAYYGYWRQLWNQRVMNNLDRINKMTNGVKLLRNKMSVLSDLLYTEGDFDRTDAFLKNALGRDLTAAQRARVQNLVLANEHNRLTWEAMAANRVDSTASEEQRKHTTQVLYDFRRQHRLDLNMHWELLFWLENAYQDNCGFERMLGTETKPMRKERLAAEAKVKAGRAPDEQPLR
jgi:hypothetical protein